MAERFEMGSKLKGESLVRRGLLRETEGVRQIRIMPDLNVIKIGGHGVIDYGRKVVHPLVEEIGELSRNNKILVATGGGARVRHILDVGIDLGMPTGVLAELAGKISEQNAIMMSILFSKYNGTRIHTDDLLNLPSLISLGMLPVVQGTPPYGLYEHPPKLGSIPPHRTDTGAFLMAEVVGGKNCILGKNVDGLYAENPFVNPDAEFIPEITADELLEMEMEDVVLEPMAVELLRDAVHVREIKVVNAHVPGNITKAINGERVGTLIRA
ncbi:MULTISPECIES: uridylate kinase [unclassified Methanoculleus]|uniref:amino acid kinase family protein n=1 Tax=unclassified Methanoculleus TaxID=2619537 RepID=UPI0025EA7E1A|nr:MULTISPECIES: uridylate kinase [unclassified Methanoculleus]MCK9317590.1 uridylate kinase [Methanoculleus sp.]MDD2254121.1 uridylate kinase [Methanoculleus sp.]MDD2786938.1 uridylate kinase [Methanoculleus sp.]MDD3215866.1 uridylate kinase [Methanoculleus sp.]MDD4314225.1 uridylate kinase [Methanoculleus sp.]